MHAGRHYTLREALVWTRRDVAAFALIAAIPVVIGQLGVDLPAMPWQPIAVLGTAVAFITGFKSNAAYGRLWEARKIWGAIVNGSRTWTVLTRDYIPNDPKLHRELVLRHIGWMNALRHQLRQPRPWEAIQSKHNIEYREKHYRVPEHEEDRNEVLGRYLSPEDLTKVQAKKNPASVILSLQSQALREAAARGDLTEYRHVELGRLVEHFYDQQGKCERIKNFPYPRQFATLNFIFVRMFILLLPFGIHCELQSGAPRWVWLTVPLTTFVAWVFSTMDRIGDSSENPFEGGPNDVPISTMSRGIEIDLRELMGETELPEPLTPVHNIMM